MKLLFCDRCWDVFKLAREERRCQCGRVKGNYLADNNNAIVNGRGYSIVIGNGSLQNAIYALESIRNTNQSRQNFIDQCKVSHCWVRPHEGLGNPHTKVKDI